MARMLGRAHQNSKFTKAECNCGRSGCSAIRKWTRREQRRIERQELRREIKKEMAA